MSFFTASSSSPANSVTSKTIFVGNLSIYCTEKDVSQLFIEFGLIESIHLKTSEKGNLSYCFIKYATRQAAEAAIVGMNGSVLLGRPLRIGWAAEYEDGVPITRKEPTMKVVQPPAAQVHVSFYSMQSHPVTEAFLRNNFEKFGDIQDVSIKKIQYNSEIGQQSGYAFIHFNLDRDGVGSAMRAVRTMNGIVIDAIRLNCSISRGLTEYIKNCPELVPAGFMSPQAGAGGMPAPMVQGGPGGAPQYRTYMIPPRPAGGMVAGHPGTGLYAMPSGHGGMGGSNTSWSHHEGFQHQPQGGGFPQPQQYLSQQQQFNQLQQQFIPGPGAVPQQPQHQFLQQQQPQYPVSGLAMHAPPQQQFSSDWRDRMDFQPGPLSTPNPAENLDTFLPPGSNPSSNSLYSGRGPISQPLGRSAPPSTGSSYHLEVIGPGGGGEEGNAVSPFTNTTYSSNTNKNEENTFF